MTPELAAAIKEPADWMPLVFTGKFVNAEGWKQYITEHFPQRRTSSILGRTRPWRKRHFQALYVACWIHQPLVKGTYMIRLSDNERDVALQGFNDLEGRWSSHLTTSIDGASAGGDDWQFLKGYKELLVKIETLHGFHYLMLKCEGHTLQGGAGESIAHGLSWVNKKLTGAGNDINPDFVALVANEANANLGISKRGAENYSNEYKNLIKKLPRSYKKPMKKTLKHGEIVAVHEVVEALVAACSMYIRLGRNTTIEGMFKQKLEYAGGRHADFAGISNQKLASALEAVLWYAKNAGWHVDDQIDREGRARGGLLPLYKSRGTMKAVLKARLDLEKIVEELKRGPKTTVRYFQEITVRPNMIDASLAEAWDLLN